MEAPLAISCEAENTSGKERAVLHFLSLCSLPTDDHSSLKEVNITKSFFVSKSIFCVQYPQEATMSSKATNWKALDSCTRSLHLHFYFL